VAGAGGGSLKVSRKIGLAGARARSFCVLVTLACATYQPAAGGEETATKIDLGRGEIGAGLNEFDLPPSTAGRRGSWTLVRDASAGTGVAIEHAGMPTSEDQFSLAIYKAASLRNADVSLRLNAAGGKSEQGGGIAIRLSSRQNYYLVQLDALRDRVLLSLVDNGASKEIVDVDADVASGSWHTLAVRAKDNEFIVSLDGIWMFTAFDKTFSQPGRIALWSKGDSVTRFDSITITPLPASEQKY